MVWLFALVYFISYITRINFGAILSEMEVATELSRTMLSMAVTGSFITYGAGQIVSGICGDRISPKKLILYGLLVTTAMNSCIPLAKNPYLMVVIWCINGFAQAFMWPPLVKLMTMHLSEKEYDRAVVRVSWGSSFGTIAVYLTAPLIISFISWKAVFFVSAFSGLFMSLIWQKYCPEANWKLHKNRNVRGNEREDRIPKKILFGPMILCIMGAIMFQGILRDGVTTWIPSYIVETYQISSVIAILTSVILPIFSVLCYSGASLLYRRLFKNPLLCAAVFFAVSGVAAYLLKLVTGHSVAGSIGCAAVLTGCMHGVNLMLISTVPKFFKRWGNVSTISGMLNSCTYIGSAASTYGIALLSERFGWNMTLGLWILVAALGLLLCVLGIHKWNKLFA